MPLLERMVSHFETSLVPYVPKHFINQDFVDLGAQMEFSVKFDLRRLRSLMITKTVQIANKDGTLKNLVVF